MTKMTHQPNIEELTRRFMSKSMNQPTANDIDTGEMTPVEPHEVFGGFRTEPVVAWKCATEVADLFGTPHEPMTPVPEWGNLVNLHTNILAIPMAVGLFPQMLQNPLPLLGGSDLTNYQPRAVPEVSGFGNLRKWVKKSDDSTETRRLVAAGLASLLGDNELAESCFAHESASEPVWLNQKAAHHWLQGEVEQAVSLWQQLPDNTACQFNLGMAQLFLGNPVEAADWLEKAQAGLNTDSGWYQLTEIYLLACKA